MKIKLQLSLIALCVFAISHDLQAQIVNPIKKDAKQKTVTVKPVTPTISTNTGGKNLVKINFTALIFNNYSLQYERALGKKISLVAGFKFMPKGQIPFLNSIKSLTDDPETNKQLDNLKVGSTVFTPEFRFYMGQGVFRGFYLAPFARFGSFTADLPLDYTYTETSSGNELTATIPLSGKINGITGGLMLGAQWKLNKLLYLDWWILGPHYGSSTGSIKVTQALTPDQQDGIREELKSITDGDNPLNATTSVDETGASVNFKGPFGGIRAGISLGFRF